MPPLPTPISVGTSLQQPLTGDSQGKRPPRLNAVSRFFAAASGVTLVTWLDLFTGPEIGVSFFYLAPVAWLTWRTGRRVGLTLAVLASIAWYVAEHYGGRDYSHDFIPIWNATVRLGFFATTVEALHRLRSALVAAEIAARNDPLTGLGNSRAFHETASVELSRSHRYGGPLSVVYLDIDNFKQVNDDLGHQVGDRVLREVGLVLRQNLRQVDYPARLGGDEFAILLPHADAAAACATMEKLRAELAKRAAREQWPITFSIGIAAFTNPAESVSSMLRRADELMYAVKHKGKNGIEAATFGDAQART